MNLLGTLMEASLSGLWDSIVQTLTKTSLHNIFFLHLKFRLRANMATSENKQESGIEDLEEEMESLLSSENYIIVDIGANLTNKKFTRDLDSVVSRARDAGVHKIMVTGTTVQSSKEALRLTRLYPESLYSTAGVHPHEAKSWEAETESELRELLASQEVVAVGECGLDFNRNFSPQDIQLEVFEKQVSLACELKKPLFIHERDAHKEVLEVLGRHKERLPSVVIHCFTGDATMAAAYLKQGCYIGLTGYVWKDKSEDGVRRILEDGVVPLDRLLVETDSPFMYPNTRASKLPPYVKEALTERSLTFLHRYCTFQRNEPCSLPVTIEMIAAYMKKKSEQVALQTTFNALKPRHRQGRRL
ncbi:hypothetical protein Pcinc_001103 [Petrolisthes cinctipes]|uniref:Deoxyribonuclease TATDN1 n=1 Tax=Petrolisthes cinctipes TaxID=88211 RepID=A0AAE1GKR2_PETCI|nr:hypothetical protein Pcinc_001103 [Petrolisthes cinctipes]